MREEGVRRRASEELVFAKLRSGETDGGSVRLTKPTRRTDDADLYASRQGRPTGGADGGEPTVPEGRLCIIVGGDTGMGTTMASRGLPGRTGDPHSHSRSVPCPDGRCLGCAGRRSEEAFEEKTAGARAREVLPMAASVAGATQGCL